MTSSKRFALLITLLALTAAPTMTMAADLSDLSLDELMQIEVTGASKYAQKATAAPSDVTVVTADDVRRFGWRNLADALRSVRGFYLTNDRTYQYVGMRGFSPPGDLNNRILFMIDGMRVNDNVYDSAMLGETFPLDIDLVERIEIVRGPGSSIYGGNAMFGVINVITRSGRDLDGLEFDAGTASRRTFDGRISMGRASGKSEWLVSASHGNSSGGSYQFPDIAAGVTTTTQTDAESWQRFFGKLSINDWHASLIYGERQKHVPTGSYGTIINDPNHQENDRFILSEVSHQFQFDDRQNLFIRAFAGQYDYLGQWPNDNSAVPDDNRRYVLGRANANGRWWGMEGRYTSSLWSRQRLVAGLEYNSDQATYDYSEIPQRDTPQFYRSAAWHLGLYVQDELAVSAQTSLTLGLRQDHAKDGSSRWSPRLAVVHQADTESTYKLLYGTAFRNPDFFERVVNLTYQPLKPEQIQTVEGVWQRRFGANMSLLASLFENRVKDVIQTDAFQYGINGAPLTARGVELEWEAHYQKDARLRMSYSLQKVRQNGLTPDNAPIQMLKTNFSLPLNNAWTAGIEAQALSRRQTASSTANVGAYSIANLTLGYRPAKNSWSVTGSIYNLFDRHYSDPISIDTWIHDYYGVDRDRLAQDGRLYRLKFESHF
jgi:outer membrane receptor protein involved in Fe transport